MIVIGFECLYFSNYRVTSGLVILAKTKEAANRISKEIYDNKTQKVSKSCEPSVFLLVIDAFSPYI
jgi:hypothetical protein